MISVYITSYNKSRYLSQAIESVLSQTLPPFEIIIVDDKSSDNSREIIAGYKSRYPDIIKDIYNEQNCGISVSRNIAISQCSGSIITYLDGDDIFYRKKLEHEYNFLTKNKHIEIVYSNFNYISSGGEIHGIFSYQDDQPVQGNIFKETLLRQYNVSSGNSYIYEMYYKHCADAIGLYDEDILIWEDWDFRIRMSKKFQYGYCPDVNSAYRKLENGLHNSDLELHYREHIKIYNKNKHLMSDLKNGDRRIIQNRVYSWLKRLLRKLIKSNLAGKEYIRLIWNIFKFIWIFKSKKAIGFLYRELFFKLPSSA